MASRVFGGERLLRDQVFIKAVLKGLPGLLQIGLDGCVGGESQQLIHECEVSLNAFLSLAGIGGYAVQVLIAHLDMDSLDFAPIRHVGVGGEDRIGGEVLVSVRASRE